FETGKVFRVNAQGEGQYAESHSVAGALVGRESPRHWVSGDARPIDFYAARGLVEAVCATLPTPEPEFAPDTVHGMHSGRCAAVLIDGRRVGYVAEVDPDAAKRDLDVPAAVGRIAVFELNADALLDLTIRSRSYTPLPRFPSVSRDLAVVIDRAVTYAAVEGAARAVADPNLLESLSVQSVYTGERVAEGKKSIAIRLTYRAATRTLTDQEADAQTAAVEAALIDAVGAARR
ncbi:MAG: phenylalanine--tRNA ligase subunit beta, partial [Capsulimonadaceae bacterium]